MAIEKPLMDENGRRLFEDTNPDYSHSVYKFAKEELSLHPIVESCLREANGDGNVWNGGLGVGVHLRMKLSEQYTIFKNDWLQSALEIVQSSIEKESKEATHIGGTSEKMSHISLLFNPVVGSRCLLVSLLKRLGECDEAYNVAKILLCELSGLCQKGIQQRPKERDCSILFGLAGALQAIWFLRKELDNTELGRDLALKLSQDIFREGLQEQHPRDFRLEWKWNKWPYLGAGIGSVGILYALLGHTNEEWEVLEESIPRARDLVQAAIDDLTNHRYESESFDSTSGSGRGNLKDASLDFEPYEFRSLCNWTHGAPGYCLLLLKAYDIFGDERYFFHAHDLADNVIWPRWKKQRSKNSIHSTGFGLDKGASGIAYVFLAMARVDRRENLLWIERARELAKSDACEANEKHTLSTSLFDGIGGLASLLIDLEITDSTPQHRCYFPFFESCQASSKPRKLEYKTRPQDHVFVVDAQETPNGKKKQHIHTKTGRSTAETATTQALTYSMTTTETPTMVQCNKSGIASAVNLSHLTESFTLEATPKRVPKSSHSFMAPTILEINEGASKSLLDSLDSISNISVERSSTNQRIPKAKVFRRSLTQISPFACSDRPTSSHKARRRENLLCRIRTEQKFARKHYSRIEYETKDNDDDSAFMSDSVERIQRAEASWIQHFGTQCEKERRGQSQFSCTNRSFRHSVGAFSQISPNHLSGVSE